MKNLRESPEVQELLGDAIRPEPVWYLNGDPWVDGVVSHILLLLEILSHSLRSICPKVTSTSSSGSRVTRVLELYISQVFEEQRVNHLQYASPESLARVPT